MKINNEMKTSASASIFTSIITMAYIIRRREREKRREEKK